MTFEIQCARLVRLTRIIERANALFARRAQDPEWYGEPSARRLRGFEDEFVSSATRAAHAALRAERGIVVVIDGYDGIPFGRDINGYYRRVLHVPTAPGTVLVGQLDAALDAVVRLPVTAPEGLPIINGWVLPLELHAAWRRWRGDHNGRACPFSGTDRRMLSIR